MNLAERLDGKVAIVTGGAGGLGSVTSRRLVEEGAKVIIADINGTAAISLANDIGSAAVGFEFDYTDEASVRSLIDTTIDRFGRIDILHNNAVAAAVAKDGPVEFADPFVWDAMYSVDVRGYMLASKYVIPQMRSQGRGVIINMSSGSGLAGDMARSAYGTMKAAVVMMSQYIATQCGKDGIRCVSIAPGAMLTDSMRSAMGEEGIRIMERHHLTPRLGEPNDLAALVVYLASEESDFVTGINIPIDGGLLAHNPTVADWRG